MDVLYPGDDTDRRHSFAASKHKHWQTQTGKEVVALDEFKGGILLKICESGQEPPKTQPFATNRQLAASTKL